MMDQGYVVIWAGGEGLSGYRGASPISPLSADVEPIDRPALCEKGHPLDGVRLQRRNGRHTRFCRICKRNWQRTRREQKARRI